MINLAQKKILVTGAHGFLGKHLKRNLIEKRKVPRENLFLPKKEEFDLRKWENCQKAVSDQDIVFHLAANVGGIGFNKAKPGELFYDNAIMGIQLMEAARQTGVEKFITVGTTCAYPKFTPLPFKEEDIWLGYPEEVTASYGLAKKMLLVQAQAYALQYGFNSIFLMPTNLYGPEDNFDPNFSHVIPALVKNFVDAKKNNQSFVEVWGTGKATREFLYVKDAAEGLILAAERYDSPESINLGTGIETPIKDLVKLISNLSGFKGEIRWDASKPEGQPRRFLDVSKAKKEFGFEARTSLEQGLSETINWYLKLRS